MFVKFTCIFKKSENYRAFKAILIKCCLKLIYYFLNWYIDNKNNLCYHKIKKYFFQERVVCIKQLLIVDDNNRELNGISKILDWEKYDIEVAGLCKNGKQALEFIENNNVDIVLADAEMPIMNGMELLIKLREKNNTIKYIFMSCYDEFEFVKGALDYGATGYILKPINVKELENVIEKVLKIYKKDLEYKTNKLLFDRMIERNCDMLSENLFRNMFFDANFDDVVGVIEAEKLSIPTTYDYVRISLVEIHSKEKQYGTMVYVAALKEELLNHQDDDIYIQTIMVSHNKIAIVFIYNKNKRDKIIDTCMDIKEFGRCKLDAVMSIAISNEECGRNLKNIHLLYNQVEKAIKTSFITDDDGIIMCDEIESEVSSSEVFPDILKLQADVNYIISSGNPQEVRNILKKYLSGNVSRNYVKLFSFLLLNVTEIVLTDINIKSEDVIGVHKAWSKLASIESIFDLHQWFENIYRSIFETINESKSSNSKKIVESVKRIIENEYAKHITMKYISQKINFSSAYINRLFKQETGKAVLDYLTDYRLNMAKKLLKDGVGKIYVVANMVGYTNLSHFRTLFVQRFGITPLEYMNMHIDKNGL